MKLGSDMRQLLAKKNTVYPTKRSMNLYFKVDRTTAPATAMLYALFAVVLLLGLSKVLIYDLWSQKHDLELQSLALEQRAAEQTEQLKDYNQVLEDYVRATPTQEELEQPDIVQLLNLIDETIRPYATISQVSISNNQVLISFSGVSLAQAADLVANLKQSPLVGNAQVDTVSSIGEYQNNVEIYVYFEVIQEGAPS